MAIVESWDFAAEPRMTNKEEFDELIGPLGQTILEAARKSKSTF